MAQKRAQAAPGAAERPQDAEEGKTPVQAAGEAETGVQAADADAGILAAHVERRLGALLSRQYDEFDERISELAEDASTLEELENELGDLSRRLTELEGTSIGDRPRPDWSLHERLAWVLGQIGTVARRGHAEVVNRAGEFQYAYDYVTEADLMDAVRGKLAEAGVAVYPSVDRVERVEDLASVGVTITFAATRRTGATFVDQERSIYVEADGTDKGDKAVNKAYTTAMRYALQKTFLVVADVADGEQGNEPRGGRARARRQTGKPSKGRPARPVTNAQRGLMFGRASEHDALLDPATGRVDEWKLHRLVMVKTGGARARLGDVLQTELDDVLEAIGNYAADPDRGDEYIARWYEAHPDAPHAEPPAGRGEPEPELPPDPDPDELERDELEQEGADEFPGYDPDLPDADLDDPSAGES